MLTRTTSSLLEDLGDPANEAVWVAFDARFRPVLIAIGMRLGLHSEDAADAAQETLARFVRAWRAGRYDRSRGRLSSWIIGIARNCIRDQASRGARRRADRGFSVLDELPAADEMAAWWQAETEREILRQAMDELRGSTRTDPKTVRAFGMVAFEERPVGEVAETLGMSANDVYLAKHRCLRKLREIVARLETLYEVESPGT